MGDNFSPYLYGTQEFNYYDPALSGNGTNANDPWTAGNGGEEQGLATWNPQVSTRDLPSPDAGQG